jgi:hypothetical protein
MPQQQPTVRQHGFRPKHVYAIFKVLTVLLLCALAWAIEEFPGDPPQYSDLPENLAQTQPAYAALIYGTIVDSGYECPRLAFLDPPTDTPYGVRLEAQCGSEDGKLVYNRLHYVVYPERRDGLPPVRVCGSYGLVTTGCEGL